MQKDILLTKNFYRNWEWSLHPLTQSSADTSRKTAMHVYEHIMIITKKHSKLEEQQQQQTKTLHVREIKKQIK